jgi:hypothetical protein
MGLEESKANAKRHIGWGWHKKPASSVGEFTTNVFALLPGQENRKPPGFKGLAWLERNRQESG